MDSTPASLPERTLLSLLVPAGDLSYAALGAKLGVTKGAIHQWTREGYVPAERVEQVADTLGLDGAARDELRRRARRDVRLAMMERVDAAQTGARV